MKRNVIITNSSQITPRQVFGEKITILANHSETGSYEVYVHDAPEGVGPPPHSHPWDEAFYVVNGAAAMFTALDLECGATPDIDTAIALLKHHDVEVAMQPA